MISATVIAPEAADADALSTALYVLGADGLSSVAAPGGDVGAILVVPGDRPGIVRVFVANLDAKTCVVPESAGVEVERIA